MTREKENNLLPRVQRCLEDGRYLDTYHSCSRSGERNITRPEILQVLKTGRHEKRKDKWDERHEAWCYAIRGKTVDKRELRVVVSFDENYLLIITAIGLER